MDDILLLLLDHAVGVLGEDALQRQGDCIHHVVAEVALDARLVEPVVAHEAALAVGLLHARVAVGVGAGQLQDVVLVVVADILAKSRLLVEFGALPLGAALVAHVVGAFVPGFEDILGVCVVLDNHEARVGQGAVEAIRVALGVHGIPGVEGHGDAVLGLDVPVVEQPLQREVHEAEGGVGIEEDDEFVVVDVVGEGGGLDPGGVAVFELGGLDKLVVVAVGQGIGIVVEDAAGDVVELLPVELALFKVLCGGQRAGFQVEDQDVLAELLLVARLGGQEQLGEVVALVDVGEGRLGRSDGQGRVEERDDVGDGGRLDCVGAGGAV